MFWVYVLRCRDGSYYTGHTDALERRVAMHEAGEIAGYTHGRRPLKLVWSQECGTREEALNAEMQVKGWSRVKKEAMFRGDWTEVQRVAWGLRNPLPEHLRDGEGASIPQPERGSSVDPSNPVRPEVSKGQLRSTDRDGASIPQPERGFGVDPSNTVRPEVSKGQRGVSHSTDRDVASIPQPERGFVVDPSNPVRPEVSKGDSQRMRSGANDHLSWPFFSDTHRALKIEVEAWSAPALAHIDHTNPDRACRLLVGQLARANLLRHCVPAAYSGASEQLDSRSLCLIRETLAYHDALADFAFAMQGLGSGAITLAGSEEQKQRYLPRVACGKAIAAFALSEPEAGSDVAAMTTRARRKGNHYEIDGCKTWISNGGIADFYCVFARTGDGTKEKPTAGISAFIVDARTPGLEIAERIATISPHPLATLRFTHCRIPAANRVGEEGDGFKIAMRTLDIFRASVAAAALGLARRALDEALAHACTRKLFGQALADFQLTQAHFADMATDIDAAALLTYRAAWLRDVQGARTTKEAAMAKMAATESAQRVIDAALQMFGGRGVKSGEVVERLYRDIRALRIYEGATEVQKLIIARELLQGGRA